MNTLDTSFKPIYVIILMILFAIQNIGIVLAIINDKSLFIDEYNELVGYIERYYDNSMDSVVDIMTDGSRLFAITYKHLNLFPTLIPPNILCSLLIYKLMNYSDLNFILLALLIVCNVIIFSYSLYLFITTKKFIKNKESEFDKFIYELSKNSICKMFEEI